MSVFTNASSINPASWGPWKLDLGRLRLDNGEDWWVDLELCLDSAAVLDWLCQGASRYWPSAFGNQARGVAGISGLLIAVRDIFQPQATLCSNAMRRGTQGAGASEVISRQTVVEAVKAAVERGAPVW